MERLYTRKLRHEDLWQEGRLKYLKKAIHQHGQSDVILTDKHQSYGALLKELRGDDRQQTGRKMDKRAEICISDFNSMSGRCFNSGVCGVFRNFPPSARMSQTILARNGVSPTESDLRHSAWPQLSSGAISAKYKAWNDCSSKDTLELIGHPGLRVSLRPLISCPAPHEWFLKSH